MNTFHANNRGFTLVEIIVSLALFAVVALIAVGAFLKIIDANKQSQSLQTAMNNTSFALESMVREMRVGSNYYCFNADTVTWSTSLPAGTTDCAFPGLSPTGDNGIAFNSSATAFVSGNSGPTCNLIHAYRFYNDQSPLGIGTSTLEKAEQSSCSDTIGSATSPFIPLVSADLSVQAFDIEVDGDGSAKQPMVFMAIKGFSGPTASERTYFTVQTSASERSMNGL
jgi:prepilin-type N-terminal cleavage/methylation domain-containing protein